MIRTVRRLRRALALATAGALCLSSFAGAPQAFAASAVPSIDIPVDVSSLTIPEQLGHITEAWQPQQPSKANGLIVYIQDIHTHPEAQAKISELIAILQKRLGITRVALEGAQGRCNTKIYSDLPDPDSTERVAKFFVNEGLMTGAEYYAITHPGQVELWGIEEEQKYLDHLNVHEEGTHRTAEVEEKLGRLRKLLEPKQASLYPAELQELMRLADDREQGKQDGFRTYFDALWLAAKKASLDAKLYPNLAGLAKINEFSTQLDPQKAQADVRDLLTALQPRLKDADNRRLKELSDQVRSGEIPQVGYYKALAQLAESYGIPLPPSSGLRQTITYLDLKSQIVIGKELLRELSALEKAVEAAYLKTDQQRTLAALSGQLRLMDKLSRTNFTREDLNLYRKSPIRTAEAVSDVLLSLGVKSSLSADELEELMDGVSVKEQFYELATERDLALAKNTLKQLHSHQRPTGILIAGGFHTAGVTEQFKHHGLAYVVITPSVAKPMDEARYQALLNGIPSPADLMQRYAPHALIPPIITAETTVTPANAVIDGQRIPNLTRQALFAVNFIALKYIEFNRGRLSLDDFRAWIETYGGADEFGITRLAMFAGAFVISVGDVTFVIYPEWSGTAEEGTTFRIQLLAGRSLILIGGPTSAGKTTLSHDLMDLTGRKVKTLSLDRYYKSRADMPKTASGALDVDNPDALHLDKAAEDIRRLLAGETVELPTFDMPNVQHIAQSGDFMTLDDDEILVVDSIFALDPHIAAALGGFTHKTLGLYLDAPPEVRLLRRLVRDATDPQRNYRPSETVAYWNILRDREVVFIIPGRKNTSLRSEENYSPKELEPLEQQAKQLLAQEAGLALTAEVLAQEDWRNVLVAAMAAIWQRQNVPTQEILDRLREAVPGLPWPVAIGDALYFELAGQLHVAQEGTLRPASADEQARFAAAGTVRNLLQAATTANAHQQVRQVFEVVKEELASGATAARINGLAMNYAPSEATVVPAQDLELLTVILIESRRAASEEDSLAWAVLLTQVGPVRRAWQNTKLPGVIDLLWRYRAHPVLGEAIGQALADAGITDWREQPQDRLQPDAIARLIIGEGKQHDGADLMPVPDVPDSPETREFLLLLKPPTAWNEEMIHEIIERAAAYGYAVVGARAYTGDYFRKHPEAIGGQYLEAWNGYRDGLSQVSEWEALRRVYDTPEFEETFGEPYDDSMVIAGSELKSRYGLTEEEIMDLWEESRPPLLFTDFRAKFLPHETATDAELIKRFYLEDLMVSTHLGPAIKWFQSGHAFALNKIGSGRSVFPMRDPRINNGRPVIVVNGYVPGLLQLFQQPASRTIALEVRSREGIPVMPWESLRVNLLGNENNPPNNAAGTIRRDASDGELPLTPGVKLDGKKNVAHLSASPLEGLRECHVMLGRPILETPFGRLLHSRGYPEAQIQYLLENPTVRIRDPYTGSYDVHPLFRLVEYREPEKALAAIETYFPPSGEIEPYTAPTVSFQELLLLQAQHANNRLTVATNRIDENAIDPAAEAHPLDFPEMGTAESARLHDEGMEMLQRGEVAVIDPAGGTGGRFGGYNLPEDHPDRQKVLARVLPIAGADRSALEVRCAHLRWWQEQGANVPLLVMGNPLNVAGIGLALEDVGYSGLDPELVDVYPQNGIHRLNPTREDLLADKDTLDKLRESYNKQQPDMSWEAYRDQEIEKILAANGEPGGFFRTDNGQPSLKPAGHVEIVAQAVLNRKLLKMARRGVKVLAAANGDDTGFVLDPAKLAYFAEQPEDMMVALAWKDVTYALTIGGDEYKVVVRHREITQSNLPQGYSVRVSNDGSLEISNETGPVEYTVKKRTLEKGGSLMHWYNPATGEYQWIILEGLAFPPGVDPGKSAYFNTNQLYFKVDALLNLFGLADLDEYERMPQDELAARVRATLQLLPTYVEIKEVVVSDSGESRKTAQLARFVGDLSRVLKLLPIVIDRSGQAGLGGYWTLKNRSDAEPAAQRFNDAPWSQMFVFLDHPEPEGETAPVAQVEEVVQIDEPQTPPLEPATPLNGVGDDLLSVRLVGFSG